MKKTSVLLSLLFATAFVVNAQLGAGSPAPGPTAQSQVSGGACGPETKAVKESGASCCHVAKTTCHTENAASLDSATPPAQSSEAHSHASAHGCH